MLWRQSYRGKFLAKLCGEDMPNRIADWAEQWNQPTGIVNEVDNFCCLYIAVCGIRNGIELNGVNLDFAWFSHFNCPGIYNSIFFNNSSLDNVTPAYPGHFSRKSFFGSRSFQLIKFFCLLQLKRFQK